MLQYIINLTGIWLISLIAFDLLLKRDTYHTYNRLFLNGSLLLGALLPLWQLQQNSIIYATDVGKTVSQQAVTIREQVVTSASPTFAGIEPWLWGIYAVGAIVMFAFLLKEAFYIYQLVRSGTKTSIGQWTVLEINKDISPFSAFGHVFISSTKNYTTEELNLILVHEQQHINSLHFIDLLLINILKIVFWFNPLVYVFEKRLLMIHEYQADKAIKEDTQKYGQFLVEQSMLQTAPVLSHSFIRSPLKTRLKMLTKQSKKIAHIKQLIIAPLLVFAVLCFTQGSMLYGQERKVEGNKITYKGNVFEKRASPTDTVFVVDPITEDETMVLTRREGPIIKLNGEDIVYKYYGSETIPVELTNTVNKIKAEISEDIKDDISYIEKRENSVFNYRVDQMVVDREGNIIYYELAGTKYIRSKDRRSEYVIPEDLRKSISKKITNVLEDIKAAILYENGEPTPYVIRLSDDFVIQ